ncbi:taste receptor type 2 member 4-like [Dendrobates tinctorius]|uniref:taste receptor type 2 member 4-like n=1 Tax=Dendrobates tinctorius TaxID=92724 RepID=UPI003CC939DA
MEKGRHQTFNKDSLCNQGPHCKEMADSTEDDTLIQHLAPVSLQIITLIPGLAIHTFITGVNVNDWWKGRSVTSVDHIVTSLAISRMCTQFVNALYYFVLTFCARSLDSEIPLLVIDMFYLFFNHSSFWLSSLLSIVFCLKISILRTRLFLYLRRVMLPRTAHFIAASGLLAAFSSILHLCMVLNVMIEPRTYNITMNNSNTDCMYAQRIYNFTIGSCMPIIFNFIASILLFSSLYHHTVKMKRSSNLSINLETYYSAMKFVSFIFIYSAVYFIGHSVSIFYYYFYCINLPLLYIFLDFLPVLHSSYLIYRTVKLRSQMSKVLQHVINFLLQGKDSENENVVA